MKHSSVDASNAAAQTGNIQCKADVTDVIDDLRKSGQKILTYPWPEFHKYKRSGERPSAFADRVKRTFAGYGYMVVFGRNVVAVMWDTNFAPSK